MRISSPKSLTWKQEHIVSEEREALACIGSHCLVHVYRATDPILLLHAPKMSLRSIQKCLVESITYQQDNYENMRLFLQAWKRRLTTNMDEEFKRNF